MSPAVTAALISGCVSVIVVILQIFSGQREKLREANERRRAAESEAKKEFESRVEQQRNSELEALRKEVLRLRTQIEAAESELLEWKDKYWTLREQYVTQLASLTKEMHGSED